MNSVRLIRHLNEPEMIKCTQTVINARSTTKPTRHFGINPNVDDTEEDGSLITFKFVSSTKFDDGLDSLPFSVQQNQLTTALKLSHPQGIILQSKEKSAAYPVLQFSYGNHDSDMNDREYLIRGYTTNSCLFKEMRELEGDANTGAYLHRNVNYIIIGFKTTDEKYNQALLGSWRDWTGARYIYIHFPEQLNLLKITLYHKQSSEDVNAFSYIVMVKCDGVDSKDKEAILLDFVQRFRAQKTSSFISIYEEVIK